MFFNIHFAAAARGDRTARPNLGMFLFPVGSAGNEVNSNLRTPTSEIKKA
jgi:hypothetical protein